MNRNRNLFNTLVVIVASLLFLNGTSQSPSEQPILVPKVDQCYMVMTDGQIEPLEWKGAAKVKINENDSSFFLIRQDDHFIYIALVAPFKMLSYVDMYISHGSNSILNLHTSSQIGERTLYDTLYTDATPPFHFGNNKDWYANETRFDRIKAQELIAADPKRDRNIMQLQTNYHYDGFEYVLKKSRFSAVNWMIRIEIKTGMPGYENIYFPKTSHAKNVLTWQKLTF